MPSSRRDQLVDTALKLFCRRGFHATGIDAILADAGVAKMTLYNHFKSKEELILAALRRRDEEFRNWFMKRVEQHSDDPRKRLLSVFDVLHEWCTAEEFNGCMFINASAEYADPANPIHAAAAEHKRHVLKYVRDLAVAAGADDPDRLAVELVLLAEGAIVWAQTTGETDPIRLASESAVTMIDRATPVSA